MSSTRPGSGVAPELALARALPQLVAAEQRLRALAEREGITYNVADFGGLRTQADTTLILQYRDADYKQYLKRVPPGMRPLSINDYRRIAPYGKSYHNYGAAFDVLITGQPAGMTPAAALGHLGALAPAAGLRWGAAFNDRPHFELPLPLDTVRRLWADYNKAPLTVADDAANKVDAIIAAGVPGLSLIGQQAASAASTLRASVAKLPAAKATLTLGALVIAGALVWVAVKRLREDA